MPPKVRAILRAQWQSLWNYRPTEGRGGPFLALTLGLIWYAIWTGVALLAAAATSGADLQALDVALPWTFLGVFAYWQLAPVLTASLGASLEMRKLYVYPISERQLFLVEVLLRLTTGLEMLLVLTGLTAGLVWNPQVPAWTPPLAALVFAVFNLFVAAGLRNLLERVLAHKRIREALVVLLVMAAALPQFLAYAGVPEVVRRIFAESPLGFWPWSAAARLVLGAPGPPFALLVAWTGLALLFGQWQFRRGLRFDRASLQAGERRPTGGRRRSEYFYRLPSLLFGDPLAAIVEKELRSLFRTPRFRLVFLMGFSFGLLIWLPLFRFVGGGWGEETNYPVLVSGYALVLLAEVLFWNTFGFDRAAAQLYFSAPVPFARVLAAKNVAAVIVVLLEVTLVLGACFLVRVPLTGLKVVETYAVALVLSLYLLAAGNLSSIYYPRPMNPEHTWGRSAQGKFQLFLLLLFPLVAAPVLLAYAARFAFESEAVFFAVLAIAAAMGALIHWVATDSALEAATQHREPLLAALTRSAGPVAAE